MNKETKKIEEQRLELLIGILQSAMKSRGLFAGKEFDHAVTLASLGAYVTPWDAPKKLRELADFMAEINARVNLREFAPETDVLQ